MYVIPKDYNNTEGKKGGYICMLYQKTTTILKVKRGVYMYVIPKDYNNTEGKKGGYICMLYQKTTTILKVKRGGIYVCYTKRLQQY